MAVEIKGSVPSSYRDVLTPEALDFVADLHRRFDPERRRLLAARSERQQRLDAGEAPDFLAETREVREAEWRVALAPADLDDRRCEITGPVERKMMINALNSGARVFMADFEDSLSPTWDNALAGQQNLSDAIRRTITFENPDGRRYELQEKTATLLVRPRGWHLIEKHLHVDGSPTSGSLFDFGLYFFHNAEELLTRGTGPYFYLPKLESHLEARLWNNVFNHAQDRLGIARGSIRATVLIETILAVFEMEEILYELKDHMAGLNAGRWDYIFSIIRRFGARDFVLPDRVQVTMTVPFMRAYTELLVRTCHRRGAHAIGGMAAFIPSRRDAEVNRVAIQKVREDKEREAGDGFDGTWVAHPDLVPVATEVFDAKLGARKHQKDRLREDVAVRASQLHDFTVPGGTVTEAGVRNNISVAIQYLSAWLQGSGAVAIFNLMEDAATAEISRSQLWQWVKRGARLADGGGTVTADLYRRIRDQELEKLGGAGAERYGDAVGILDELVLSDTVEEFLTLRTYEMLD
ncbi:MAG TPA: malate synthase A [Thermoanaerobaculia bacterium]|nr:malate synthase A [Thermoanaerobaculia bacterium]